MKRLLYGLICCGSLMACQQEVGYRINGSVPGTPDGMKVYLFDQNTPVDSALTKDGKFLLQGKVEVPALYGVFIDLTPDVNVDYQKDLRGSDIFVDNSDIQYACASIDSLPSRFNFQRKVAGKVTVTGSPTHDLYMKYRNAVKSSNMKKSEAWDKYLKTYHIPAGEGTFNTREGIALVRQMDAVQKQIEQIQQDFIKANPQSPVAIEVAQGLVYGKQMTKKEMDQLLQSIDTSLWKAPAYKQLKESTGNLLPVAIGEKYLDIELVDENGETVRLADYVKPGQYNMVEFWASWCGPCRYEIPHLRHVYEAYGKDGLNMISVSIDNKDKDWKAALKEEKMNWTQLCDMKGWQGEVVSKYKVMGVPFSLLLDGDGKVIAREVRGSELDVILIDRLGDKFKE